MAYSLKSKDGSLQKGARRIAVDQIRTAIAEIDDASLDRDATIHQVRKRCKKLRGLVRLVRPGFKAYAAENARYRDAARRLSGLRDADVLIETHDRLVDHFEAEIDRRAFGQIRRRLTLRRKDLLEKDRTEEELEAFRAEMERARADASKWSIGAGGFGTAIDGMEKTYKRARKAMQEAGKRRSDEAMHDWRKRVKYHRFHAQLLRNIWPEPMAAHADAADRLGDILGDHHDLAVFADVLRADPEAFGSKTTIEAALGLVDRRKRALEARAFDIGSRLFAEKPKRIADRWSAYRKAWDVASGGNGRSAATSVAA